MSKEHLSDKPLYFVAGSPSQPWKIQWEQHQQQRAAEWKGIYSWNYHAAHLCHLHSNNPERRNADVKHEKEAKAKRHAKSIMVPSVL